MGGILQCRFRRSRVGHSWRSAIVCATCVAIPLAKGDVKVDRLRCEYLENPLGIDAAQPRLSWNLAVDGNPAARGSSKRRIKSSSPARRKTRPTTRAISGTAAASKSDQLDPDSLRRQAARFARRVFLEGPRLGRGRQRVGLERAGPLDDGPAEARRLARQVDRPRRRRHARPCCTDTNWIWYPEGKANEKVPVGDRYFRRTFDLPADRKVKRARYLATADNQCKAFINGRDIGGRDNYRTVKDSDLTYDMKPGKNLLAVVGMNKGDRAEPGRHRRRAHRSSSIAASRW